MTEEHVSRLSLLKWLIGFSIVSTGLHYTHNFAQIDQYPGGPVSDTATQVAILVSWPLFTAVGLLGYRLYSQGRYSTAHVCLASYSLLGLTTLGHFLSGNPDIPLFFYVTILTDGLAGASILAFTIWSARMGAPESKLPATAPALSRR
jgi:hypothetical protein